jgi:hypothetical protein
MARNVMCNANDKPNGHRTASTREITESFLARMHALHASPRAIKAVEEAAKEMIEDEERALAEQRHTG